MAARGLENGKYQGSKWITRERRLAIYIRDGLSCVYCGSSIEDGITLSLDHITPHSKGGTNLSNNLVTCCKRCNSARGDRSPIAFARAVAQYLNHDLTSEGIIDHIADCTSRIVNIAQAKQIIERRGSWGAALATAQMEV